MPKTLYGRWDWNTTSYIAAFQDMYSLGVWEGIDAFDASADIKVEQQKFKIRAILMWTISNFSAS
jgi:hypothetical protein